MDRVAIGFRLNNYLAVERDFVVVSNKNVCRSNSC